MKASKLLLGIPILLCAMFIASNACAQVITVNNPSFEILPDGGLPNLCGTGCSYSVSAIPDWTESGGGQFQPGSSSGNFAYFNSVPDGVTVAYSNGGTISQTVTPTVQSGVTYTLTVYIGLRNDGYPFDGTADLMLGGTVCDATGTQPALGDWSLYTARCTGNSGNAGDPIVIQLNSSGAQGDFDNVMLSASTTPEPASFLLFGTGLLGIAFMARKKFIRTPQHKMA